jgi:hypothetical protein
MTENILHVKHRLKLPAKHFIDFSVLTVIAVAPWFWWFASGGGVALTVSIIVSIVALGLLFVQLVGGIKIRRNTTLHFEADVSTHTVSSWMEKPPTQWRNILSPSESSRVQFDSFDNIFMKKVNSKPVLYLANKDEHGIKVILPYRLAHVPEVKKYVTERISESKNFNDKSLTIAEKFFSAVSEEEALQLLEV